jgi:hypothetical protein
VWTAPLWWSVPNGTIKAAAGSRSHIKIFFQILFITQHLTCQSNDLNFFAVTDRASLINGPATPRTLNKQPRGVRGRRRKFNWTSHRTGENKERFLWGDLVYLATLPCVNYYYLTPEPVTAKVNRTCLKAVPLFCIRNPPFCCWIARKGSLPLIQADVNK